MLIGILMVIASIAFTGYYILSWSNGDGLAAWISIQANDYFGSVSETWTIIVPMIIAMGLAFGGVGRINAIRNAGKPPPSEAEKMSTFGKWFFSLGAIAAALGAWVAFVYAPTLPDGTETPISLDIATVDLDNLPVGQLVQMRGRRAFENFVTITSESEGRVTSAQYYVPILPNGAIGKAPVQFVQRLNGSGSGRPTEDQFMVPGYLQRNGVDILARDSFESGGLKLAETIYSIQPLRGGLQEGWLLGGYIATGVGVLLVVMGVIFLFIGAIGKGRDRRRAAKAEL